MGYTEQYIKENLRRGIGLEAVKSSLLSAGYTRTQISESIKKLYREQVKDLARYINSEMKHGLSASEVRNYLAAIGHPRSHVEEAIEKIILAKKYLLRKKRAEKTKEQFRDISRNINNNISKIADKARDIWDSLETWQKFSITPSAVACILLFFWEITMVVNSIILSGSLNCYSFGRIVTCSFFESLLFYVLLMLAFILIFCLPIFLIGALVGYIVQRFRG